MDKNTGKLICAKAIDKWGERHQIIKAVEELGELSTALAKYLAEEENCLDSEAADAVVGEIADVEIVVTQLRLIFDEIAIERQKDYKLNRLRDRVNVCRYSYIGRTIADLTNADEEDDGELYEPPRM